MSKTIIYFDRNREVVQKKDAVYIEVYDSGGIRVYADVAPIPDGVRPNNKENEMGLLS